jgi:hypothetical protein
MEQYQQRACLPEQSFNFFRLPVQMTLMLGAKTRRCCSSAGIALTQGPNLSARVQLDHRRKP